MSARSCARLVDKTKTISCRRIFAAGALSPSSEPIVCPLGVAAEFFSGGSANFAVNPYQGSQMRTLYVATLEETGGTSNDVEDMEMIGGPWTQENTLSKQTDFILNEVPTGEMTIGMRKEAGRLMLFWSRKESPKAAIMAERLLERLVCEQSEHPNSRFFEVTTKEYNIAISAWGKGGSKTSGVNAEAIWRRMEKRFEEGRRDGMFAARPDGYTIHSVMNAYARSPAANAPEEVQKILSYMEEQSNDPQSNIRADTISFNILMNAYASRQGEFGCAEKAEDVLLRMSEINRKGGAFIRPDAHSFNTVLKAWYNSGNCLESASRADQVLRFMLKLHKDGHENVRPDPVSLGTCLRAYGKVNEGGLEAVKKIDGLLELLEEVVPEDTNSTYTECFNIAMDAILKSGVGDAAKRVEDIFDRMIELKFEGNGNVSPDHKTLALLLNARLGSGGSACNTEESVHRILNNADGEEKQSVIKWSTASLNKAMDILWKSAPKSGLRDAAKQAGYLLTFMETSSLLKPDSSSYNIVITAFVKIGARDSAEKAFEILKRQEKAFESGNAAAKPVAYAYNTVLTLFSKVGGDERENAQRASEILKMMEKQQREGNTEASPDIISYNIALKTQAQAGTMSAANSALLLLKRIEESSATTQVHPDEMTYGTVINAFRLSGGRPAADMALSVFHRMKRAVQANGTLRIDMVIYKTVLTCLARGNTPYHAKASYEILREMSEHASSEKRNEGVRPDSHCCNLVLKAYAGAGYGVKTATIAQKTLFDLVQRYRAGTMSAAPGTPGFNQVLGAWSKTKDRTTGAVENAETIMKLMRELQDGGLEYVKPDKATMSLMLSIYSTQKSQSAAQNAQDLFDTYVDKIDCDRMTVENLMNVWAKSDAPDKTDKIRKLKRFMEERWKGGEWNMRPTARTYNILLNACSHSAAGADAEHKRRVLECAREVFREFKDLNEEAAKLDSITYGTMIQAVCNLSPEEDEPKKKAEEVKEIFDECCMNGMVGDMVLKEIRKGLGTEVFEEILGGKSASELPVSWKRNVKDFRSKKLSRMLGQTERRVRSR